MIDPAQIIRDYVEGRMPHDAFLDVINSEAALRTWINHNAPKTWKCGTKATPENNFTSVEIPWTIENWFEMDSWMHGNLHSLFSQYELYSFMERLLKCACPEMPLQPDRTVVAQLAMESLQFKTRTQKIKDMKQKIKELFHLDGRRRPYWIQNAEWPVLNGKPMQFVKTIVVRKSEWKQHVFVNPESGEERIVDDVDCYLKTQRTVPACRHRGAVLCVVKGVKL